MKDPNSVKESSSISIEQTIERVRETRDQLISNLLKNDSDLHAFLETHFEILALSSIKMEFLKRNLRELKDSPLDLVHYSSLIKQMKETGLTHVDDHHLLFQLELKSTFQKGSIVTG